MVRLMIVDAVELGNLEPDVAKLLSLRLGIALLAEELFHGENGTLSE